MSGSSFREVVGAASHPTCHQSLSRYCNQLRRMPDTGTSKIRKRTAQPATNNSLTSLPSINHAHVTDCDCLRPMQPRISLVHACTGHFSNHRCVGSD
jgi:hypothetical protein